MLNLFAPNAMAALAKGGEEALAVGRVVVWEREAEQRASNPGYAGTDWVMPSAWPACLMKALHVGPAMPCMKKFREALT